MTSYQVDKQPLVQQDSYQPAPQFFPQQQQSSNTNVVVTSQPSQPPLQPVVVHQPASESRPGVLIFAIVLTISMAVLFIPALACVLPGLVLAIVAHQYESSSESKQDHTAKTAKGLSLCCNVSGLIFYSVFVVSIIYITTSFRGLF